MLELTALHASSSKFFRLRQCGQRHFQPFTRIADALSAESLLFKRSDLEAPNSSTLFAVLTQHSSVEVRSRIEYLRTLLGAEIDEIPFLTEEQSPLLRKRTSTRH